MDITSISGASAYQQLQTSNAVQTSVAAKVLDSQRQQGAAAIQMLQASTVQPSSSGGTGSNGRLDVTA